MKEESQIKKNKGSQFLNFPAGVLIGLLFGSRTKSDIISPNVTIHLAEIKRWNLNDLQLIKLYQSTGMGFKLWYFLNVIPVFWEVYKYKARIVRLGGIWSIESKLLVQQAATSICRTVYNFPQDGSSRLRGIKWSNGLIRTYSIDLTDEIIFDISHFNDHAGESCMPFLTTEDLQLMNDFFDQRAVSINNLMSNPTSVKDELGNYYSLEEMLGRREHIGQDAYSVLNNQLALNIGFNTFFSYMPLALDFYNWILDPLNEVKTIIAYKTDIVGNITSLYSGMMKATQAQWSKPYDRIKSILTDYLITTSL